MATEADGEGYAWFYDDPSVIRRWGRHRNVLWDGDPTRPAWNAERLAARDASDAAPLGPAPDVVVWLLAAVPLAALVAAAILVVVSTVSIL